MASVQARERKQGAFPVGNILKLFLASFVSVMPYQELLTKLEETFEGLAAFDNSFARGSLRCDFVVPLHWLRPKPSLVFGCGVGFSVSFCSSRDELRDWRIHGSDKR